MTDINKKNKRPTTKIFKIFFGFGVFLLLLFFGLNNNVYAQSDPNFIGPPTVAQREASQTTSQQTLEESLQKTKAVLDLVLKSIYMLSRPLLVIAGNAMDNSLVYGSVFHLDLPLRQFWNIMKNFANYALGFVLLYHILKSLFTRKGVGDINDPNTPLGIIKKILIAGILIQASRFMVSAVIDISTIATYSIGGMPLTILKNDNNDANSIGNQQILGVSSTINIGSNPQSDILDDITTYRTYGDETLYKIANCRLGSGENGKYIIGKEINFVLSGSDTISLQTGMCVLRGSIYRFNEFEQLKDTTTNPTYKERLDQIITANATLAGFAECGYIIPIYGQNEYDENNNCLESPPLALADFGYEGGKTRLASITGTTVSTLIDKSKGFVGPLITIYSSALNFSQLNQSQSSASSITFGIVLEFAIKTMIGLMLILPIGALAIIMVARIGILWMIIAFIPIIIIDQVLLDKKISGKIKALDLENIIKVIFAPVLVVFGLSISLIFMSTLTSTLKQYQVDPANPDTIAGNQRVMESFGFTKDTNDTPSEGECHTILSMRRICTNLQIGGGLDNISYFLINIFGIAIMWSLLFWTISMTGNIGEKVGKWTKDLGQNFAGNIPIVPIPGGSLVGVNQIAGSGGFIERKTNEIENNMSKANTKKMEDAFPQRFPNQTKSEDNKSDNNTNQTINQAQAEQIISQIKGGIQGTDQAERETEIQKIIEDKTGEKINGSITDRIKKPENVKLLFAEFEKLTPPDKQRTQSAFEGLLNLKIINEYKESIPTKDFNTIINDLNANRLEALITVPIDTDIELLEAIGSTAKKKYKIKKKSDGKYEAEAAPVVPPTT